MYQQSLVELGVIYTKTAFVHKPLHLLQENLLGLCIGRCAQPDKVFGCLVSIYSTVLSSACSTPSGFLQNIQSVLIARMYNIEYFKMTKDAFKYGPVAFPTNYLISHFGCLRIEKYMTDSRKNNLIRLSGCGMYSKEILRCLDLHMGAKRTLCMSSIPRYRGM